LGAISNSAERNWLDASPRMETSPPRKPRASISRGRHSFCAEICAPKVRSAPSKSPMGRCLMRGTPSTKKLPSPRHNAAVKKRVAVPALPRNSSASSTPNAPPRPSISNDSLVASARTEIPSCSSAALI
jgi:hypothetical protein